MSTGIITQDFVKTIIEKRRREIHKGDCGRILIAAGTEGMAGAAVLAARAALRTGSGLVQVAVPRELFPVIQTGVPEATCLERDFSKIDLSRYDAAAIGPGLGESENSVAAVKELLQSFGGPLVLDADGLNIIAKHDLFDMVRARPEGMTVITPHMGEARRLLADETNVGARRGSEPGREEMLESLRRKTGAVVVLKGHKTLVATADAKTYINTTGNPGMATAGSGDVLTGMIASLAGQRKPCGPRITASEAAVCGVFLHGTAGDLAAMSTGEYGLTAGDLAYYASIALKKVIGR